MQIQRPFSISYGIQNPASCPVHAEPGRVRADRRLASRWRPRGPSPPPGLSLVPRDGWRPLPQLRGRGGREMAARRLASNCVRWRPSPAHPRKLRGGGRLHPEAPERDRSLYPLPLAGRAREGASPGEGPRGRGEIPASAHPNSPLSARSLCGEGSGEGPSRGRQPGACGRARLCRQPHLPQHWGRSRGNERVGAPRGQQPAPGPITPSPRHPVTPSPRHPITPSLRTPHSLGCRSPARLLTSRLRATPEPERRS